MTDPRFRVFLRLALGLRGDAPGLAELDRLAAAELAELEQQIAELQAEHDRWADVRPVNGQPLQ
jgi:hypothetical protein